MADKFCFMICPFGAPGSDVRKRSDLLLEYIVKPSVEDLGYRVERADISAEPGIVTVNVIQHLIEDDLVVADITDRNPNVFYELAIRHAILKPYVQAISTGQVVPFNIQEIQTVVYDLTDVESIKRAIRVINKQVDFYENGGRVTSPVTQAVDSLVAMRSMTQLAELMQKVSDIDENIIETKGLVQQVEAIQQMISSLERKMTTKSSDESPAPPSSDSENLSNFTEQRRNSRRRGKEYTVGEWIDKHWTDKHWK